MTAPESQPISRLDERVDEMLEALTRMPQLEQVIAGMRLHEDLAAQIGPDVPGAVDVLAGADFRRALINVMDEVLFVLNQKEAGHGHKD